MGRVVLDAGAVLELPPPVPRGGVSLEEALARRRSVREFVDEPLTERQLAQLLWAAQGVTHSGGFRTAPSAGALYPLELYAATGRGLYHYEPEGHCLTVVRRGDLRPAMGRAALDQSAVGDAPAVLVLAAVPRRTARRYGEELTWRYIDMELGHAAQNILLQAAALGLGGVPVGAFHEDRMRSALKLPAEHQPRYLIPVGRPR